MAAATVLYPVQIIANRPWTRRGVVLNMAGATLSICNSLTNGSIGIYCNRSLYVSYGFIFSAQMAQMAQMARTNIDHLMIRITVSSHLGDGT
jgi:hypothetical protein